MDMSETTNTTAADMDMSNIKLTNSYFDYLTGPERVEGEYNVLVNGVNVGTVARDDWSFGYWDKWKVGGQVCGVNDKEAGRQRFEKRSQAVDYLVKRSVELGI